MGSLGGTGHDICTCVQVWGLLPADTRSFVQAELDFFVAVTEVSGKLYKVPKDERKAAAMKLAREVSLHPFGFQHAAVLHSPPDQQHGQASHKVRCLQARPLNPNTPCMSSMSAQSSMRRHSAACHLHLYGVDAGSLSHAAAATGAQPKADVHPLCVQIQLPREDLYMPVDPRQRVLGLLPDSATPMQSAAKVPILVAFRVVAQVGQAAEPHPAVLQHRSQIC